MASNRYYLDISIGTECSGTLPTCSHAVSVMVKDERKRNGTKWIDRGLMNGIEIFKLLTTFPDTVASDIRPHFEPYRACRNDATSVKQRYKKHVKFNSDPVSLAAPVLADAKKRTGRQPKKKKQKKATAKREADSDDDDVDDGYEEDGPAHRVVSPYDIGVVPDDESVPKAYVMYTAPRLNVKRKRRTPRTTAPPYTTEPLDLFTGITAEHMASVLETHGVGPCCSSVNTRGWEWDPDLFKTDKRDTEPVKYPLRIQNLVSKCVIAGKEKLNPDDFRNACQGNIRQFPAHTAKFTTCSQTLFEEGQMNIAGRTDQFDATRWIYLLLYYLARITGKMYTVQNSGVVNIATSTDLKHKINLTAFRDHLLSQGHVAVYEPDHFPGSQWNFVPAGRHAEAYARALARAKASQGKQGQSKRKAKQKRSKSERGGSSSSSQKGPVVQAFPTGKVTLVGVQSVRSVRVAEATIIPFIADLVRTFPPVAET